MPCADRVKFGVESPTPNFTPINAMSRPCGAEISKLPRSKSNLSTGGHSAGNYVAKVIGTCHSIRTDG